MFVSSEIDRSIEPAFVWTTKLLSLLVPVPAGDILADVVVYLSQQCVIMAIMRNVDTVLCNPVI